MSLLLALVDQERELAKYPVEKVHQALRLLGQSYAKTDHGIVRDEDKLVEGTSLYSDGDSHRIRVTYVRNGRWAYDEFHFTTTNERLSVLAKLLNWLKG